MRLLLDTHVFLRWLDDPNLLSDAAKEAIQDGSSVVYVSAAVVWEIVIKKTIGKLDAPEDLPAALAANRFVPLSITIQHALAVASLPLVHRDPFDRILIAQARCEGLTLVSRDPNMPRHGVPHIVA
ncbi:type II toxin-antitoxin system VapC family toxin [Paludisphaera sp.]|uniref:type II toxin-antitoxin system VapC family toxin n=1 Tax=Paludisphaera sp. TaxID=2017432 RepID=UPI00301C0284